VLDAPPNGPAGKAVSSQEYFISGEMLSYPPLGCFICEV